MKIQKVPDGYTLRRNPSELVVSVVVLTVASLALLHTLANFTRSLPETLALLACCSLLYGAGIKALVRERRGRLTVTREGVYIGHKRTERETLLPWENVKDWGTAVVFREKRQSAYHPRTILFFSSTLHTAAENAVASTHSVELVKFDRETLEASGFLPFCRDCIAAAQGEAAPTERVQWQSVG